MTLALTPHELAIAQKVCTPRQLEVLDLRRRGLSHRACAWNLDLSEATIRGHIHAAERRIVAELRRELTPA